MGQQVPKIKARVSHDYDLAMGHSVQMPKIDENAEDVAWHEQFRVRLKEARGARSQQDMAELLCITRDAYSKYEGSRGTVMPVRLMPKFCKICAVTLDWLIEGDKNVKPIKQVSRPVKPAKRA